MGLHFTKGERMRDCQKYPKIWPSTWLMDGPDALTLMSKAITSCFKTSCTTGNIYYAIDSINPKRAYIVHLK